MAVDVGSAVGYLDINISKFVQGLKTAREEAAKQIGGIGDASMSVTDKISTSFTTVGKTLESAGKSLTLGVTTPIIGAGTAITKVSSTFESEMSKVVALSGATGDELVNLSEKAKEMGATTKYTASEAAQGMQYMALAGWDTAEMLDGIEPVLKLAGAAEMDLGRASDIVTDALTAMGLQAKDAAHFTDVLTTTMANSNTDVDQMGEAFKYAAPLAGTLGYSIEDLGVALGTMANAGIKGEQAGSTLRNIITNMTSPTDDCADAMERLNLSLFNADGSARPLRSVMNDLRSSMQGLTEEEQLQLAEAIAGKRGLSGLLAVVNATENEWRDLVGVIDQSNGATEKMYQTMQDNFKGQLTILKSTFETIALDFGEVLLPILKKVVEKVQEFATWLHGLSKAEKERIVRIAAIVAALGPLLLILGKFSTAIGSIISTVSKLKTALPILKAVFTGIKGALAGIAGPVAAVVAVIGILIAAFKHLWDTNEEFRERISEIWNNLKERFQEFGAGIVERLNNLGFKFESFIDVLKAVWDGFCNFLAPIFEGAFNAISIIVGLFLDLFTGWFDIISGLFTGDWSLLWQGVKEVFSGVWNAIKGIIENAADFIKNFFDMILGLFGTSWDELWGNVKNTFTTAWNAIKAFFTEILPELFNKVAKWGSDLVNKAKESATNVYNKIVDGLKNLPSKLLEIGKNLVQGLWNGIAGASGWLYNKVVSFAQGIISKIKSALGIASPSKVMSKEVGRFLPPGIGNGFVDALPSMFSRMRDKLNDGIKNMRGKIKTLELDSAVNMTADWNVDAATLRNRMILDYDVLAERLAEVLRLVPITPQVVVEMEDGDVVMDGERVGRKIAPVVSRVVAQGQTE